MTQNSDVNSQFIGKDPNAGKDWGQKKKRAAEDELVGRHHQFSGHKLGQTPGDGEGQGGMVCCSPSGHKESQPWLSDWRISPTKKRMLWVILWLQIRWPRQNGQISRKIIIKLTQKQRI